MKSPNTTKKKLSEEDRRIPVKDPSKLFAEFFNGAVIELDKEYGYES